MRLIDIDDVIIGKRNPDVFIVPETAYGWNECLEIFRNAPTVDAVPVVRGRWIDTDNYFQRWKCSVCKKHTRDVVPPFCPNCGAKMNEDDESTCDGDSCPIHFPGEPKYDPDEFFSAERSGKW